MKRYSSSTKSRSRTKRSGSSRRRSSGRVSATGITLPTQSEMKKLCADNGFDKVEPIAIEKLREVYRTLTVKILKSIVLSVEAKKRTGMTEGDIMLALTTLFGTRFQKKMDEIQTVMNPHKFRKMMRESTKLLVSTVKPNLYEEKIIQGAVELAIIKGFLAPIAAWLRDDEEKIRILTLDLMKKLNQVYLVSGSEFYAPSIVKYSGEPSVISGQKSSSKRAVKI